jgi:hypothetical protein
MREKKHVNYLKWRPNTRVMRENVFTTISFRAACPSVSVGKEARN